MICARKGCKNKFEPRTHNQKYCCDECCKIATNLNIKNKYQEKKQRLAGKKRLCKTKGCSQALTKYNEGSICNVCLAKEKEKERKELLEMLNGIS